ncbi:MAG: glycosyltransferase, partial [Thermodesulfobacteriota bacterium]
MNSSDRKKSICFLTNAYPDEEGSYRGIFVKGLAERLIRRGYEISVVTPRIFRKSVLRECSSGGLRVRRFPFWSEERLLITYRRIPWFRMVTYFLSGLYCTWEIIRSHGCLL